MSYNKVVLIGHVGEDPDVRYFDAHSCVSSFSLATNEGGYTRADGERIPERTDWHRVVVFGSPAHFVEDHVRKGVPLLVEGRLRYQEYVDRQGVSRRVAEVLADKVCFLPGTRSTDPSSTPESKSKEDAGAVPIDDKKYDLYRDALDADASGLPF